MEKILKIILVTTTLSVFFAGCANTVRKDKSTETVVTRTPQHATSFIRYANYANDPSIINITVNKEINVQVVHAEDEIYNELETPYSGWRELYEVPAGIGVFPAALVVNILDFASLGFIPNWMTDDMLDYSFAAMNPCMNAESSSRVVKHELRHENKIVDQYVDSRRLAAVGAEVKIMTGQRLLQRLKTDHRGEVKLRLFSPNYLEQIESLAEVDITVKVDNLGKPDTINIVIPRRLRYRLVKAREAIKRYRKQPTPQALAQTVLLLEDLRFSRQSLNFERAELVAHSSKKNFLPAFRQAVKWLTASRERE
jgi:hypothetical protein